MSKENTPIGGEPDCSRHKKEIAGISDMKVLAEMIGDLHYEAFRDLLYHLYKKVDADANRDNEADREKLAAALQYAGMSIFESALRIEKVWKISEPFMTDKTQPK
jgi:hypothetical protein